MDVQALIRKLGLQPHPEGGYYRQTYRGTDMIRQSELPARYRGDRSTGTAIYYLLTADTFSCMHLVQSDEIFHFYLGDPVEQLLLYPDGSGEVRRLGSDALAGHQPQALVPHGVWQGARLIDGGSFALMGATVSPGFDFADFREGDRAELAAKWPEFEAMISKLTRR